MGGDDRLRAGGVARARPIGLVRQLKHSTYFAGIGLPLEGRFLASIAAHRYTRIAPLIAQPFETANLRYLRRALGRPANLRLMQLTIGQDIRPADVVHAGGSLTYLQMITPAGLSDVAADADILAPDTRTMPG